MKSRILSALVLLGLVSCGDTATEPGSTTPEPSAAVEPTPTPMRPIASPEVLAAIHAREPERSARALAEVERRFASRTPGIEFRINRVRTNQMGDTHVWIQQVFQGTPVVGRDLGVILFVDDALQVLGAPDDFKDVPAPRLTVAAGLARARAHVKSKGLALKGDGAGEGLLEPVYERRLRPGASGDNAADYETVVRFERGVRVKLGTPASPEAPSELFVREQDGAVLERGKPSRAFANATLRGKYAGTVTSLKTQHNVVKGTFNLWSPDFDAVVWTASLTATPTNEYTSTTNDWGDGQYYLHQSPSKPNGQTAAADAMVSMYGVRRMWSDIYLQRSWDGNGTPVEAVIHYPDANAYAAGGGVVWLGYLYSNTAPNNLSDRPLTDIETVGHEVGHMAFADMTGVIVPTDIGELAGMNEGTADIFGTVAGFYLPDALATVNGCPVRTCGTYQAPITVRGDWMAGNTADSRYGRSFIDPFNYPAWRPDITAADGHDASGPLRRMFYFLSVGVLENGRFPSPGLTNPQRPSPYLPRGMAGLGINTANWLWYHTLSGVYFSRINSYHDAREMMLEATTALYERKPYTPQYKQVEDAWAAVNVGPPADRKLPEVSIATQQLSPTQATVTVDVTDENGLSSGTVVITSALNGHVTTHSCTDHCVIALDPAAYGTHTAHSVKVTAKDTRENETSKQVTFALDVTKPSVTLTQNTPADAIAPKQDWKYMGSDASGLRSFRLLVDGVPQVAMSWGAQPVPSYTANSIVVDLSNHPEALYPVRFETVDRFGNTQLNDFWLAVDRTPPELCNLSVMVDPANNGKVYLTLTARDNVSGLQFMGIHHSTSPSIKSDLTLVPGGVQRVLSHTAILAPGTYTFYASCMDQRWNTFWTPHQPTVVMGNCNTTAVAGGAQVDERTFVMGKASGTVTLRYRTFGVDDRIRVFSGTTQVADTGCTATGDTSITRSRTFSFSGTTGQLRVRVEPNCNPDTALPTTEWDYSLSCP
jgi:Zn-dependent metalloprotease